MNTTRLLLPFTHGVDMDVLEYAVLLAKDCGATLVPLALIHTPEERRLRGARLEHVQQSKDFLEVAKHTAARHSVPIDSPYRSLARPLLAYIDTVQELYPEDTLTVILPEYVVAHWWEHLLHNQTALRLKIALLSRPGIVVTDIPQHLRNRPRQGRR